jgi:hypothetical protein
MFKCGEKLIVLYVEAQIWGNGWNHGDDATKKQPKVSGT